MKKFIEFLRSIFCPVKDQVVIQEEVVEPVKECACDPCTCKPKKKTKKKQTDVKEVKADAPVAKKRGRPRKKKTVEK